MIAHLVETGFGGFYDGAMHLLVTVEDLLLVLGLCLLAGARGKVAARRVLIALPAAWLLGGILGALTSSGAELLWPTSLSFLGVGALVAIDARSAFDRVVPALAALLGGLHGFANGAGLADQAEPAMALAGIGAAVFVLTSLCVAFVTGLRRDWQRIAIRVAGSWIAAVGVLTIAWMLKGDGAS